MDEDQVIDTIQRWRQTPEEDLRPEDYQLLQELGSACLSGDDYARLLNFVQEETNQGIVKSMGCALIAPLVKVVVEKQRGVDHHQAAIAHLTQICRAEEVLHSLLEQLKNVHPGVISETIVTLVPHFQTVVLRLGDRKAAAAGQVLTALHTQLTRLPVPYSEQQEAADEFGVCHCCGVVADFTRRLTQEVMGKRGGCASDAEDGELLKTELLKFCMRSLREPLLEAQLNSERKSSSLRLFATEIMVTLAAVHVSTSELLFFSSRRRSCSLDKRQSLESRACLSYLLFVQLLTVDSFPAVFSPVFVLQCNMEYVSQLLTSKQESHLLKGLALFRKSLESVQDNSLPVSLLELRSFYNAPQNLCQILTDCPMQHLRTSGLQVFQLFINKLDIEAKHKFFRCMLKTSDHAGIQSYIVKNIKNYVEFSMKPGNDNKWFLGEKLLSLLRLVLRLPQGAQTNLLDSMDRIMESLNLLRYLLIRDRNLQSATDMWTEFSRMKDEYLRTLRVSISMSRGYYSAELKGLTEDRKLKAKEARQAARSTRVKSLTVKHTPVSHMSPEVQHQVLQSALVTFELMESLIVRIEELTEDKLKIPT